MGRPTLVLVLSGLLAVTSLPAAKNDWKDMLKEEVTGDWKFGKAGGVAETRIETGTPFKTTMDLKAYIVHSPSRVPIVVKDGQVKQRTSNAVGFVNALGASVNCAAGAPNCFDEHAESLVQGGETVYPTRFTVRERESLIELEMIAAKPQQVTTSGTSKSVYYEIIVLFEYRRGTLKDLTASDVEKDIALLFRRDDKGVPVSIGNAPASSGASNGELVGKTTDQMTAILGKNYTTTAVGSRTIYLYKELDLRVVVENGKVVSAGQ